MRRTRVWLMCLALGSMGFSGSGVGGASAQPETQKVEPLPAHSIATSDQLKQPPALPNRAHQVAESDEASSMTKRASRRADRGNFAGALADIEIAIRIRGDVPELSMMKCMLSERLSGQAALTCYADVVKLYAKANVTCESNLNCVIAASMAEMPKAPIYRRRYLEAPRSAADQGIADTVLTGFNREAYLHSILP